jgi:glutathione synthase
MTVQAVGTVAPRRGDTALDFVFVIDELSSLQPGHDSSVALMEAAQLLGHRVLVTTASGLGFSEGRPTAECQQVTLRPAVRHEGHWLVDADWSCVTQPVRYRLDEAHAVFMRTDPPVNADYLRATYLLDLVDPARTVMVNSPAGVRNANEKLFALRIPHLGPPTVVSADRRQLRETVAGWGRAVLKPTDGMAGRGVLILDPADPNLTSILDTATERGTVQVVVQRWLAESIAGDRRVIVLDGRPLGVVRRVARAGEFRCNMAAGGEPVADSVTDRDREICAALAPLLREHGLSFVGIDVIGDFLTEVNVTSPTGLREIDALTGSNLAGEIISWATDRARSCRLSIAEPALGGLEISSLETVDHR